MATHGNDEIVDYLIHSEAGRSGAANKAATGGRPAAGFKPPASGKAKGPVRRRTREERLLLALVRLLAAQHR